MERIAVTSSLVKSVGFHPESQTLEVELVSGPVYQYYPVAHERAEAFFAADASAGRLINDIKRDPTIAFVRADAIVATTELF